MTLNPEQRQLLEPQARARSLPARVVERARIVLRAATGQPDKQIAAWPGIRPEKSARWRNRLLGRGWAALQKDASRPGGAALGLSGASVRRIWQAHGLKPHLLTSSKVSRDPQFAKKLGSIVGLYLNPPEHAIVLCADDKRQIQALDRMQPGLPLRKGRCGTLPTTTSATEW